MENDKQNKLRRHKRPKLALLKKDKWLEPTANEVEERYERYKYRLKALEDEYGSLTNFANAYKYLGINYDKTQGGWYYREWAPNAKAVFLFGDFNDWHRFSHPLTKNDDTGVWEIFLDENNYKDKFTHGSKIKVLIHGANDAWNERIPAYITRVVQDEYSANYSAQLWFPKRFDWQNDNFTPDSVENLFIYESHVGMAQEREGVGTYIEFAEKVLPRIKAAGYNAVQLMAIAEHPYYGSFGYHVSNFFAPSSRFGTPEELKMLVRKAHSMGIAVIMDIVHSHTVKNINEGLNEFDGTQNQYFHPPGRGDHPSWDSKLFDYGKREVLQFLLSNLKYWIQEYHFDGFRFDGVTSMMYFHHGYGVEFDHQSKFFQDGVEFDAIAYLQLANKLVHTLKKGAVTIAEDVSGMPGLTDKQHEGGIGFDYRLGMGLPDYWVKLLKEKKDEQWNVEEMYYAMINRKFDVKTVAYAESHDQALVGDKTLAFWLMDKEMYYSMHLNDQNPVIDRGIALHKMIRLFTISLGGDAYLNFMGNEFGHPEWIDFPREGNNWSHYYARRQWSLVDNPDLRYRFLADFDRNMLKLIDDHSIMKAEYPTLLKHDDWHKTVAFLRGGLIFVFNWHINQSMVDYEIPVPEKGFYKIIFNSDDQLFGGHHRIDTSFIFESHAKADTNDEVIRIYCTNRTALVLQKIDAVIEK